MKGFLFKLEQGLDNRLDRLSRRQAMVVFSLIYLVFFAVLVTLGQHQEAVVFFSVFLFIVIMKALSTHVSPSEREKARTTSGRRTSKVLLGLLLVQVLWILLGGLITHQKAGNILLSEVVSLAFIGLLFMYFVLPFLTFSRSLRRKGNRSVSKRKDTLFQ